MPQFHIDQDMKTEGVILQRESGDVISTNVPRLVLHHSSDREAGYEWGYNGSGPAELSLNILENVMREQGITLPKTQVWKGECLAWAYQLHQAFKTHFIAPLHRSSGEQRIPYADILAWLNNAPELEARFWPDDEDEDEDEDDDDLSHTDDDGGEQGPDDTVYEQYADLYEDDDDEGIDEGEWLDESDYARHDPDSPDFEDEE